MEVITGAVWSLTVMVCVWLDALPQTSVAVYVRATEKRLAQLPGVVTSEEVIVTVPVQLSVATTAAILAAGTLAAHLTV
jgi:hypothetical protein